MDIFWFNYWPNKIDYFHIYFLNLREKLTFVSTFVVPKDMYIYA